MPIKSDSSGTTLRDQMARDPPQPGRDLRKAQKITTIRPKFKVHVGNP
jgi:hypothetical protein